MRIILLGATGQIGKVLYEGLTPYHSVIGTSRKQVLDLITFDPFKDNWSLLGKADVVINCVGQIYETKTTSFEKIHIELTELIIKHRELLGNPRIIQLSALGASENHSVQFLRTKGLADAELMRHSNVVIVRPSIVCTHRTMLVKKMRMLYRIASIFLGTVVIPKNFKEHKIQPIMPDDLIKMVSNLCEANPAPLIIDAVGPERISFEEIIMLLYEARKEKYRIIELPQWLFRPLVVVIDKINERIISLQQYQLLFSDNISDKKLSENFIGKSLSSTRRFWEEEFKS